MKTTAIIIMLIGTTLAQNVYEVKPGSKGNEIKLTVANVSEENPATNVTVRPPQPLQRRGLKDEVITFHQSEQTIDIINPGEEREIIFTFDVERTTSINRKDTIEFMIFDRANRQAGASGIMMMKSFIFSYTVPKEFKLEQNYPNPFNPSTVISYQLPVIGDVSLKVYDILGSEVAALVNEEQQPGYYEVKFSAKGGSASGGKGSSLASGMYVYRLTAGDFVSVKKMVLIK